MLSRPQLSSPRCEAVSEAVIHDLGAVTIIASEERDASRAPPPPPTRHDWNDETTVKPAALVRPTPTRNVPTRPWQAYEGNAYEGMTVPAATPFLL